MASRFDYSLADLGGRFQQGIQQSQDNKRRNALLDLEQRQYGLNEQRVGLEQKRYDQAEQERLANMQAQEQDDMLKSLYMAYASGNKSAFPKIAQLEGLDEEDLNGLDPDRWVEYGMMKHGLAPDQPGLPSSFQEYSLGQQDPGYMQYLQQQNQPKPTQEPDAIRTLRLLQANPELADLDAGRRNKPPSGYRQKEDGSGEFEPIPGGPADLKIKAQMGKEFEAKKKVGRILDAEIRNIDLLIGSDDGKTTQHPGIGSLTGSIESKLPTFRQKTANAGALLESLKSKASINALREIRSGGSQSIGQITEREWPRLEGMKVALSEAQSEEQFIKQLQEYREELKLMRRETEMAEIGPPQAPQQQNDSWTDL